MMKKLFSEHKIEISRLLIELGAVLTGIVVFLLTLTVGAYFQAAPVYQDTLRLHIRAASDSAEDQALKLMVRDRLTGLTAELTEGAENAEQAAEIVDSSLALICREAEAVLADNECDAVVSASVEQEFFNTRSYPTAGGEELTLQVKGSAGRLEEVLSGLDGISGFEVKPVPETKEQHRESVDVGEQANEESARAAAVIRVEEGCDIREEMFYRLAQNRLPILELHVTAKSLEEIFLELTEEEDGHAGDL